jgi:ABC-type Fe3+ transport system permease subunit
MSQLDNLLPLLLLLLVGFGPPLVSRWFRRQREAQQRLSRQQGQPTPALRAMDALSVLARSLLVLMLVLCVAGFGLCGGWGVSEGLAMVQHSGEQRTFGQAALVMGGLGLVIALGCLVKLIALLRRLAQTASSAPSSAEDTVLPPS